MNIVCMPMMIFSESLLVISKLIYAEKTSLPNQLSKCHTSQVGNTTWSYNKYPLSSNSESVYFN